MTPDETMTPLQRMAKDHCDYTLSVYRKAYTDAFIHGYGHGREDALKEMGVRDVRENAREGP